MPLTSGTRLGHYEVLSPIGAGGMGEVYRARDTTLDRDVAIKVLPAHMAEDPDALARFEREAKAVAALSHPNILAIHDFSRDEAAGVSYAAMELLEGETLRDRLANGALPPKKVVQIGVDIARGLAAAHARGVVHRDLKPENVFVTTDGRVKILDFGLARPMALAGNDTNSPTALRQTDPGTVLGTIGYMAPEQVKGQAADHRSDIFALGCVLFELATGRRAFHRDTPAETMTAILRDDPPEVTRDGGTAVSGAIDPVIRHCLEKQPDERFQSARDLAFALESIGGTATSSGSARAAGSGVVGRSLKEEMLTPTARRLRTLLRPTAFVLFVVAAFMVGLSRGQKPSDTASLTFQQLTDDAGVESEPSISPDGVSVAFTSARRGSQDIFVQRIGGRNAVVVAGDPDRDEGAPVFSPDGASIAFHEVSGAGGIFITGATGESTRRVTDFGANPSWSPDGQRLVFCTEAAALPQARAAVSALWVVDAKGGAPTKLSNGDAMQPVWSPSGRQIAYWAVDTGQRDIYTMPSAGGPRVAITSDAAIDWNPQWSADGRFLYFASDRGGAMNVWRVPMDEASGTPSGAPESVTAGVATADQISLAKDGRRFVFRSYESATNPIAIAFDPATEKVGAIRQILDRSGSMGPTGVSPDGRWLALTNLTERQEDVFIVRVDGSDLRRVTDDMFRDRVGVFSPDGKEIAFYSNRANAYHVFAVKPDGSGLRALSEGPADDTRNLLYPTYAPTGDRMIASRMRTPDTFMFDPRRAWTDQKPELLDMRLPDGSWLVPTAWSPDGKRWAGALSSASGKNSGVGLFDVASRTLRRVTDQVTSLATVVWLHDSRRIVFLQSSQGPHAALTLLDVDSGRSKQLTSDGVTSQFGLSGPALAISPDGRTLYAGSSRQQGDIWLATLGAAR